jgi:hypothetical protein
MSLKKKLKRLKPPPVPGQVKLLSLLAIVLVCGAPALVSVIDDSMQSEQMVAMGSYTEAKTIEGETFPLSLKWDTDTPEEAVKSFSFIPASENDGTNVFVLNAISSKDYMVSINTGVYIDSADFEAGVSKIVLNFVGDVSSIRFVPLIDGTYSFVNFTQIMTTDELGNEIGTNSWELELDQVMLTKLRANDARASLQIYVGDDFDGTLTWTSETYRYTTIAYGEIIIGATGALLCFCALMATPWFGIGRRSKS